MLPGTQHPSDAALLAPSDALAPPCAGALAVPVLLRALQGGGASTGDGDGTVSGQEGIMLVTQEGALQDFK